MTTTESFLEKAAAHSEAYRLYVVDEALRVVLSGSDPSDLAPTVPGAVEIPALLRQTLERLVIAHDFAREPIARASIGKQLGLRCMRTAGRAGNYFMVMTSSAAAQFEALS